MEIMPVLTGNVSSEISSCVCSEELALKKHRLLGCYLVWKWEVLHWHCWRGVETGFAVEIISKEQVFVGQSDWCHLCLSEKLAILENMGYDRMLNKWQELVAPCKHVNKFLMRNIGVRWKYHTHLPPLQG